MVLNMETNDVHTLRNIRHTPCMALKHTSLGPLWIRTQKFGHMDYSRGARSGLTVPQRSKSRQVMDRIADPQIEGFVEKQDELILMREQFRRAHGTQTYRKIQFCPDQRQALAYTRRTIQKP